MLLPIGLTITTLDTFSSISVSAVSGYVYTSGTSTTNGVTYNIYSFETSSNTPSTDIGASPPYTITYSCSKSFPCYVLAVGGGGGGGSSSGAGGGGGGVVMMPIILPVGINQTITIGVGNGGNGSIVTSAAAQQGYNTYVNFTASPIQNITAFGGGSGGWKHYDNNNGGSGSSGANTGGSCAMNSSGPWPVTFNINTNYNFGNMGGMGATSFGAGGGGGGATTIGATGTQTVRGDGGNGIQCLLPGIKDYKPSTTLYGNYYWGGGGGGCGIIYSPGSANVNGGNGGKGGGGGGSSYNAPGGSGDITYAISSAIDGGRNTVGGSGGANTGGGGGGSWYNGGGGGGDGGSGIVIIAFPTTVNSTSPILLSNYNFINPDIPLDTASISNYSPIPNWTVGGAGTYYIVDGSGSPVIWNSKYCPYSQFFYTTTTTTVTLSQTIGLMAKNYSISFSAAVNSGFSGSFTISVSGVGTVYTSSSPTSASPAITTTSTTWNVYLTDAFPISSMGSYTITFTFNCPIGITQILVF